MKIEEYDEIEEMTEPEDEDSAVLHVGEIAYVVAHVVIPLVLGRIFGVVVERCAFAFVVYKLSKDMFDYAKAIGHLMFRLEHLAEEDEEPQKEKGHAAD